MEGDGDGTGTINHGERLGAWVRERRKALGLTQEEVAGRMGGDVPINYVTTLETGGRKRMIGQPRVGQLARALGAREVDLLRGAGLITEPIEGPATLFPDGDPRATIVSLLPRLSEHEARLALRLVEAVAAAPPGRRR